MRNPAKLLLMAALAGLPLLAGCESDGHHSYGRDYDRHDWDARTAGYDHRPWRDDVGNVHHDREWRENHEGQLDRYGNYRD